LIEILGFPIEILQVRKLSFPRQPLLFEISVNPCRRFMSKENSFHRNFVILGVREGKKIPSILERTFVPSRYCIPLLDRADPRLAVLGKN